MRPRDFLITLDPTIDSPLFVQISEALSRDIARGRLRPGDALPGSRTLADTLGVHRSTVIASYAELAAQGWVSTRGGSATFVAAASPEPKRRHSAAKNRQQLDFGVANPTSGSCPSTCWGARIDASCVAAVGNCSRTVFTTVANRNCAAQLPNS